MRKLWTFVSLDWTRALYFAALYVWTPVALIAYGNDLATLRFVYSWIIAAPIVVLVVLLVRAAWFFYVFDPRIEFAFQYREFAKKQK